MLGQRIHQARRSADLTLEALGERLGVTKAAVKKYENGYVTPDSAKLLAIAEACGVRTEYFFRKATVDLSNVEFRKKSGFGKKRAEAVQIRVAEQIEKRIELLNAFPEHPIPRFSVPDSLPEQVDEMEALEKVADDVRQAWSLGLNPIGDLTDTLENLGFMILAIDVDHKAFSGMTATAVAADGQQYPVIAVSTSWPGDRQRFTLAHELAHVLLADRLAAGIDEEKACDRLAGAFLAPQTAVIHELGERRRRLEPKELYRLKHEYGLSMRGWAMRALQCGIISHDSFLSLMRIFSARRWNRREPGEPIAAETPKQFEQLVYHAVGEELISEAKAAELLGIPRMQFYRERCMEPQDAAAYQ
ncbi:helix-turn-helix domain-containing protein [Thioalkalivibrio halophilus]|uniref:Transcriptional regulator n=1 Tax=Thioalkalivibrio halophilus TaxID=252474 RepID=A0A1V3A2B4_9GAMM|nr:XRE family transcriptional regulator [Thioalkalivibrio halophilus]OOC11538.1 transcriptional regulator [Thioalkalivibrio halophilus]